MKDLMTLLGFGAGLVTGMILYKHSQGAKQVFNKGEKTVMDNLEKSEQKLEKETKKIKENAEKIIDKTEKKINDGVKNLKEKLK